MTNRIYRSYVIHTYTSDGRYSQYGFHIGDEIACRFLNDNSDHVQKIVLRGKEIKLLEQFNNIPKANDPNLIIYYGDMAKFIAANVNLMITDAEEVIETVEQRLVNMDSVHNIVAKFVPDLEVVERICDEIEASV